MNEEASQNQIIFDFASGEFTSEIGGAALPALCEGLDDKAERSIFQEGRRPYETLYKQKFKRLEELY